MFFCQWCGNTIPEGIEECPYCNDDSSKNQEAETIPISEPPKEEPVHELVVEKQVHSGENGVPTDDGLHIVHNGRLIELNRSQDGQHYLADGNWYLINQPPHSQPIHQPTYQPTPQPIYQPSPKPVYQPAPQPVYQPAPQYVVEEVQESEGRSLGSIVWLLFILLLVGVRIAIRT